MSTAFVLSGGASLGAVQVGMLQALVARGITPELIVGTSVGALNGAFLATGATSQRVDELAQLWRGLKRGDVFPIDPITALRAVTGHADHLVPDRGLRKLVERNLTFQRLQDAPIPLHVIATDVLSGKGIRLSAGPAVDAVLASAAIPAVFPPVDIDGRPMMDGGVVENTPITHAVELGATTIWVLTTGAACALDEPPHTALGMGLHGLTLAINDRLAIDIARYEGTVDLRVAPPLCPLQVSPADFSRAGELIERAERGTSEWLDSGRPSVGQAALLQPHQH